MPDPALSAAIREAYASAPENVVTFHTLELWHPAMGTPIRVVRDSQPLDARLEVTAPRDPGEVVTFTGYAFDILPPDQTATAVPTCTIEIDNVDRSILAALDAAILAGGEIVAIYREFLSDTALDGPETDPPLVLTLVTVSATPLRIRATAGFPDLLNTAFPRAVYTLDRFPGLAP